MWQSPQADSAARRIARQEDTQDPWPHRDASRVTESGKVTVVTFNDSKIIDEAEIQEFGQELYDLVEREGKKKIVLNFAQRRVPVQRRASAS